VNGTAASAVVALDYPQVLFRHHLSLLKIGEEWKIVNKVFSAERRDAGKVAMDDTLKNWTLPFCA
jgi:Putative lumazine-binding